MATRIVAESRGERKRELESAKEEMRDAASRYATAELAASGASTAARKRRCWTSGSVAALARRRGADWRRRTGPTGRTWRRRTRRRATAAVPGCGTWAGSCRRWRRRWGGVKVALGRYACGAGGQLQHCVDRQWLAGLEQGLQGVDQMQRQARRDSVERGSQLVQGFFVRLHRVLIHAKAVSRHMRCQPLPDRGDGHGRQLCPSNLWQRPQQFSRQLLVLHSLGTDQYSYSFGRWQQLVEQQIHLGDVSAIAPHMVETVDDDDEAATAAAQFGGSRRQCVGEAVIPRCVHEACVRQLLYEGPRDREVAEPRICAVVGPEKVVVANARDIVELCQLRHAVA